MIQSLSNAVHYILSGCFTAIPSTSTFFMISAKMFEISKMEESKICECCCQF